MSPQADVLAATYNGYLDNSGGSRRSGKIHSDRPWDDGNDGDDHRPLRNDRERMARIQAKKAQYRRKMMQQTEEAVDQNGGVSHMHGFVVQNRHNNGDSYQQAFFNSRPQYQHQHNYQPQPVHVHQQSQQQRFNHINNGINSSIDNDESSVMSHEKILQGITNEPPPPAAISSSAKARAARQKRLGSTPVTNKENVHVHDASAHLRQLRARRVRQALRVTDDEADQVEAMRERRHKEAMRDRVLQLEREQLKQQQEAEQRRLAELERQRQAALFKERLALEEQKRQLEQDQKMMQLAAEQRAQQEAAMRVPQLKIVPVEEVLQHSDSEDSVEHSRDLVDDSVEHSQDLVDDSVERDQEDAILEQEAPTMLGDLQGMFQSLDVTNLIGLRCGCLENVDHHQSHNDSDLTEHDLSLRAVR